MLSAAAIGVQRAEIQEAQGEFVGRYGARTRRSIERFNTIPYVTIEADAATLEQMKRDGLIKTVEEDAIEQPTLLESTNIIGAPAAWSSGFDGSGWAVAVLDTGVDKNHSFLNGRVVSEACYSSTTSSSVSVCPGGVSASTAADSGLNCDPTVPGCAHGTHVAGTVAGTNATFSGVAKNAGIIAIQVFSRFNTPSSCPEERAPCVSAYVSDQIRGLERVFALRDTHKIAAVNMSLGGGRYYSACDSVQSGRKAVIDNLRSVKIATVVSSGNDSRTDSMGAPACISSAISVGSTGDGSSAGTINVGAAFPVVNRTSGFDFDDDGRADIAVRRPATNEWYSLRSMTGFTGQMFGVATDIAAPADYDGDGKTDIAVFRPTESMFYISGSSVGFYGVQWGQVGDLPVPADYDGDGRADVAVYRPDTGDWYRKLSASSELSAVKFGIVGDKPVTGDFDGDGKADVAVFRPSENNWYLLQTSAGFTGRTFGEAGDITTPSDFDGDGKTDVAVFRPSTGIWYVSGSAVGFYGSHWGQAGDIAVAADYTGDGISDPAVFRPSDGNWYIAGHGAYTFGVAGDVPVESVFAF
ncbi:MAG: S8 family serine peptidase [Acidobacteria bacterium]|nr:S8 family serine peptidase [Acidobacteriota bacterium]